MLALLRLMRPHQWVKNVFVFTGLLFGHAWHNELLVQHVIIAAVAFSLISSCIYIFNDIIDREQDRRHPKKQHRPLAAGAVSLTSATLLAGVLGIAAFTLGAWVSPGVLWIILAYAAMNLAYSLRLKHVVILDISSSPPASCYASSPVRLGLAFLLPSGCCYAA